MTSESNLRNNLGSNFETIADLLSKINFIEDIVKDLKNRVEKLEKEKVLNDTE